MTDGGQASGNLDGLRLQRVCADEGLPWQVEVHAELPSTSDELKNRARIETVSGVVVFAESQTAGRGRRSNQWISGAGVDLLFSVGLRPSEEMALWPRWTSAAALAVCEAIDAELGLDAQIKWPNDVYVRGKKVAGLLLEIVHGVDGPVVIIGIGLNVNGLTFPAELATQATSLRIEIGGAAKDRGIGREDLAIQLLRALGTMEQRLDRDFPGLIQSVRDRSWLLGKQVRLRHEGTEIWGKAVDLDAEGNLILLNPVGERISLTSAEQVRAVSE